MSLDNRLSNLRLEPEATDVDRALNEVRRRAVRMRLVRRIGAGALVAAAVAAAIILPNVFTSGEPQGLVTNPPKPAPGITFRPAEATGRARLITYMHEGDIWLYDVKANEARALTTDGREPFQRSPKFFGRDYILYIADETIQAIPVIGGSSRELVRESDSMIDFAVSPSGDSIAYIAFDEHALKLLDIATGRTSELRRLGIPPGGGAGSEDEVSVSWSPDGSRLLVTDTHVMVQVKGSEIVETNQSIFLMDARGVLLRRPWSGTHARWSPDGGTIYYRGYAGVNGIGWHAFDLATKQTRNLGIRAGTNNISVSPDGRRVAYDTSYFGEYPREAAQSGEAPVTYAYHLGRGAETLLREGALAPVWLDADELIVMDVRRPDPKTPTLNSWEPLGTVSRLSLSGGRTVLPLKATWDADVLYDG